MSYPKPVIMSSGSAQRTDDLGIASIAIVQSTTTGAGAAVWAIRNKTVGKFVYLTKIWFQLLQSGTGAATEMKYEFIKGTGCTGMAAGATGVTPLLKKTGRTNPNIDCQLLDTGLTQTGITQGAVFFTAAWSRLTHSATQAGAVSAPFLLDLRDDPIELLANEVLSIRNAANSVVGDTMLGGVEFYGG